MASPIVLTLLPAPTIPEVVTSGKIFAGNYAKLADPSFTQIERKIIQIVSLIHAVTSAADYRSNLSGVLPDAEIYMRGISNIDLSVAYTVTHWSSGYTADSALTTDPVAILKEGQRFQAYGEQTLDRIIAYLCACGPV